jgi:putative FmdB family regulatory protein
MPIYTYECEDCGVRFDTRQKFSDDPITECPECGGHVHRVPQPVGVVFKGSGWYVTDSRGRNNLAVPPKQDAHNTGNTNESSDKPDSKSSSTASGTDSTPPAAASPKDSE